MRWFGNELDDLIPTRRASLTKDTDCPDAFGRGIAKAFECERLDGQPARIRRSVGQQLVDGVPRGAVVTAVTRTLHGRFIGP